MSIEKKYLYFSTDIKLELNEILDKLQGMDYDQLMEGMVTRKLIEPSEVAVSRKHTSSILQEYYLEALDKLKFKFMSLHSKDIDYIIELAKKS